MPCDNCKDLEAKLAEMEKYCRDASHSWADGHCRDCGKEQDPGVLLYLESRREVATLTAALGRAREAFEAIKSEAYGMRQMSVMLDRAVTAIAALPPLPADAKGEKKAG